MGTCQHKSPHSSYIDTVMGTVQAISHNNASFIKLVVPLSDRNIYEDWQKNLLKIDSNKTINKFLLIPVNRSYNQCNLFCTGLGEAVLLFPVFKETLEERCQAIKASEKYMTEKDILYLAYMLTKVFKNFLKNNQEVGDLALNNIVYNQFNEPQLICKISFPNYDIVGDSPIKFPDCLDRMSNTISQQYAQKQNLFKIGMLCLCCASQQKVQQFPNNMTKQLIRQKIQRLNTIYSSKICDLLTMLLDEIFQKVVTIQQINDYLQKYQIFILTKQKNVNNSSFFNIQSEKSPRINNISFLNGSEISSNSRKRIFQEIGNSKVRNYKTIGLR